MGRHSFRDTGWPPGHLEGPQPRSGGKGRHTSTDHHEAVAREMAMAHAHYQAILNERGMTTLPTSLKISSGSHGFKVMDPFNWTKDKSIY